MSELARALTDSAKRRQMLSQMERAIDKKLREKTFAEYLATKLDGPTEGLKSRQFIIDETQFKDDVRKAIAHMVANKAIGKDRIHVEMHKSNPDAAAELLTRMWQVIGKKGQVPADWLKGTIVPL